MPLSSTKKPTKSLKTKNRRLENGDSQRGNSFNGKEHKPVSYAQQCADTLYEELSARRKIPVKSNLASWAKWIGKIVTSYEVPETEVCKALDWYVKNIGEMYVPVCYSGRAFHDKFSKVVDAMDRSQRKPAKRFHKGMKLNSGIDPITENDLLSEDECW